MIKDVFDYAEAFSRNRGLISNEQQLTLSTRCVAIAGCGGVGSAHAHTLARLGVGRFKLADGDTYSVSNFNRQFPANLHTLGRNKSEVTAEMILAINPDARVEIISTRIGLDNVSSFVHGADVVVDGIDFFEIAARRLLFQTAWSKGSPALTAAPLGFSATLHVFNRGGMHFDDYFDLHDGQSYADQIVNFILGLAPSRLHASYMDLSAVDPETGRGPSSVIGVQLAASLVAAEVLRIVLYSGAGHLAPGYVQFDALRQQMARGKLRKGNRNWLQRLKRAVLIRRLRSMGLWQALEQKSHA
jgi:molybdopterin/thiamine biosynthesis adenylyltransferase